MWVSVGIFKCGLYDKGTLFAANGSCSRLKSGYITGFDLDKGEYIALLSDDVYFSTLDSEIPFYNFIS